MKSVYLNLKVKKNIRAEAHGFNCAHYKTERVLNFKCLHCTFLNIEAAAQMMDYADTTMSRNINRDYYVALARDVDRHVSLEDTMAHLLTIVYPLFR